MQTSKFPQVSVAQNPRKYLIPSPNPNKDTKEKDVQAMRRAVNMGALEIPGTGGPIGSGSSRRSRKANKDDSSSRGSGKFLSVPGLGGRVHDDHDDDDDDEKRKLPPAIATGKTLWLGKQSLKLDHDVKQRSTRGFDDSARGENRDARARIAKRESENRPGVQSVVRRSDFSARQ